ncbi:MAG: adenylate/guanylate cyclase domain-containing protein [Deltaproteobacteria bacterium]|nr:adenylate/guanylate cyclase domain-containing protein [Deltaproteobacteria bacterium]
MKERWKKILSVTPLKIAILVILSALVLFFFDAPFLRFMELKALDLRMISRGATPSGGETVIVVIDEKSLSELGRWPWPRTTLAKLVDVLKSYGAKAVGFDIIFAEPDENSSMKTVAELSRDVKNAGIGNNRLYGLLDQKQRAADTDTALAASIKKAKNVTLGYFFHISKGEVGHLTEAQIVAGESQIANARFQMVRAIKGADEFPLIHAYAPQPNLPKLSKVGRNAGYFNAFPDSDGVIRWSPLVIKFRKNYYYSLAMAMLLQYQGWPMSVVNIAEYGVENIQFDKLRIPTDESGRMLVNYLGPARTFPHYAISDVIQGRVPADKIKGKIVLVGATATGIYDMRVTPFSAVYPGVEIHATVIDNILHRNFLIHSGWIKFLDVCMIILVGFIMGLTVPRMKAVTGIVLSLALIGAFVLANTMIFVRYNVWMNLIYPVLTMMAIYLGITVYRYVTEEREKKKVRGAFQYYLTASVVNEILKDPSKLKLGGDKKNLSVMFSDIRGFTSISEKLSPEELVHLLNEYLTAMTDVVFKYDGLLDKYIGDAIMAVFGAPLDQPDHALRACRTGIGMMAELRRLREKWAAEGRPDVNIGVGINTGDMVVGNMGSQMRFDYTVMGDSVNLASRLEGTNKEYGTNIIISEFTYEKIKDDLFCRELDAVRVKGKKLPVRIFELLGEKKDAAQWREFVGRFETGLAKYREGLWDEAIAAFRSVLDIRPADTPAKLYIDRCKALKENPPVGEWDGVFTMTKK